MPQEDDRNRRPPRHLRLLKLLREDGKSHVFNDIQTLLEVTEALFNNGQFIGTVRGHERYGMYFDKAIGYRIDLAGNRLPLYFAEMKIIKGEYHVIPRTKPSEAI